MIPTETLLTVECGLLRSLLSTQPCAMFWLLSAKNQITRQSKTLSNANISVRILKEEIFSRKLGDELLVLDDGEENRIRGKR